MSTSLSKKRVIYLATQNQGKIKEIQEILGDALQLWELRTLADLATPLSWDESGQTFVENATIKAQVVQKLTGSCVLAEDSGLCVPGLQGEPGVYSSRYAGKEGDHQANNQKLLRRLSGFSRERRQAYFICCLVFLDEQGQRQVFEGRCEGEIVENPRGSHGFGYDPIFQAQGFSQTMAEMQPEQKNAISHRKKALRHWLAAMS